MSNLALRFMTLKGLSAGARQPILLSAIQKNVRLVQSAGIKSVATLQGTDYEKPKPWDYKEKGYAWYHCWVDHTIKRFDENTKLIVVEGPIAAGKTDCAIKLAEELGFKHFEEPTMDSEYINSYGYDLRELDPQLPKRVRSYDEKDFNMNPTDVRCGTFQIIKYKHRFFQYMDALAHMLNTGEGVILERSPYSDVVFVETMTKLGYISKGVQSYYNDIIKNTIRQLLRPHLIIYLDVPIPEIQNRIKERNRPWEVNSQAVTQQFLEIMEEEYKQRYLKIMSIHSELLVYDWSSYGDTELMVDEIERINFDRFEKHEKKLHDWRIKEDEDFGALRHTYTNMKGKINNFFNVPRVDVPEILISGEEDKEYWEIRNEAPGEKYGVGFNPDMGDKVLFKL